MLLPMVLGRFVWGLVIVLVAAAGALSPAWAGEAEGAHATGHAARAGAQPACPMAERDVAVDSVRAEASVPDCHDVMAEDAICVAGHCALCLGLPAALPLTVGDQQASNVATAGRPLEPGRCTAPDTPPRIA